MGRCVTHARWRILKMIISRLSILLPVTISLAFAQPNEVLIPMRDGVKLATDLYFPEGARKDLPAVLERLPYNKKALAERGAYFAARGYVFAAQDVRGRFRSEGRFEPFLREGPDGYDAIEWLASQPASAAFPAYARNLNTGENSLTGTRFRKASVTVHRGASLPSSVELPVIP